jgi:hypothetical protein
MAERLLSGPELDALETGFEKADAATRADGSLERLLGLADALQARFRPDPGRMAEAGRVVGCLAAVRQA